MGFASLYPSYGLEKPIVMREIYMKSIEKRSKYDDYEMLDEYDFSDGIRGRFYTSKKVPIFMQLDKDIVIFF